MNRMLAPVTLGLMLGSLAFGGQERGVKLVEMNPVSLQSYYQSSRQNALGGIVIDNYVRAYRAGSAVYDVGQGFTRLEFLFGALEGSPPRNNQPARFTISLDGKEIRSGSYVMGDPPAHVSVTLPSGRSLQIQITNYGVMGNATLFRTSSSPPPTSKRPELLSPAEGFVAEERFVTFRWKPLEGATEYAVQITQLERDSAGSGEPRMWTFTVRETAFEWPLASVPSGRYLWTVLGFDSRKVVGKYSLERELVIDR